MYSGSLAYRWGRINREYTVLDEQAITALISELRKGGWRNTTFPGKLYVSKSLKSSSHVLVGTLREDCPGEDARQKRTAREKSESRAGNMKSITTPFTFIQDNLSRMQG